jgi:hypothetical protein
MATGTQGAAQFGPAFLIVGAIAASSGFVFLAMPLTAGASLVAKRKSADAVAAPAAAD